MFKKIQGFFVTPNSKDLVENYKPLNEYTHEELYRFLEKNSSTDHVVLACICSEILRRQLKEKYE